MPVGCYCWKRVISLDRILHLMQQSCFFVAIFDFRGDLFNFPSSQEDDEPSRTGKDHQKCVSLGCRQVPSSELIAKEQAVGCAEVGEAMEVDVAPLHQGENRRAPKEGHVGTPEEKTVPESGSSNSKSTQVPGEHLENPAGPVSAATQTASAARVEVGTSTACAPLQQCNTSVQTEREFKWRPGSPPEASPSQVRKDGAIWSSGGSDAAT